MKPVTFLSTVEQLKKAGLPHETGTIPTYDGLKLFYYGYKAQKPKASLVFIHGGGAHGMAGYGYMAEQLAKNHNIHCYLPDLRGHGQSEGPRGYAQSKEQIWQDVDDIVQFFKEQNPQLPLYLGGHSSGAGVVINYAIWAQNRKKDVNLEGYFLVAPRIMKKANEPFASVNYLKIFLQLLSFGCLFHRSRVVRFNYPEKTNDKSKLVRGYNLAMSEAVSVSNPLKKLQNIRKKCLIIAAQHDELFSRMDLEKILQEVQLLNQKVTYHFTEGGHLTILNHVHQYIERNDFLKS